LGADHSFAAGRYLLFLASWGAFAAHALLRLIVVRQQCTATEVHTRGTVRAASLLCFSLATPAGAQRVPSPPPQSITQLAAQLRVDDSRGRFRAVSAMFQLSFEATHEDVAAALDTLIEELHDGDSGLRSWAAAGIVDIIDRAPRATQAAVLQPLIEEAVRDTVPAARLTTASALWQLGDVACPAVPTLLTLAADHDPGMRWRVAVVLGEIGLACLPDASAGLVLAALKADAADTDEFVRSYAVQALGELGAAATAGLSAALAGSDSVAAGSAAGLLGQLPPTADVVEPLLGALGAVAANVRLEAAYALGGFGPPVRDQLNRAAHSGSASVRDAARKGIWFYERAARSPVADRCYAVVIGTWVPDLRLGADTIFLRAPPSVRFATVKYDEHLILDTLPSYRVEPAPATPRLQSWIGYWVPAGDSVHVGWSNGFSGFGATLGVTADTLRGTASSHWDFDRETQTASITFIAVACR